MSILTADKKLPDSIPDGYHYYMYKVVIDNVCRYGCFIGESASDVLESPSIEEFEGGAAHVCEINRDEYIDFVETMEAAEIIREVDSVNEDRPAV